MPSQSIAEALRKLRGIPSQNVTSAGQGSAPGLAAMPGLDQAYNSPMTGIQSAVAPPSPFAFNPGLENKAQALGNPAMNPWIQSIMQRFGLLNMLRNRSNEQAGAGLPQ